MKKLLRLLVLRNYLTQRNRRAQVVKMNIRKRKILSLKRLVLLIPTLPLPKLLQMRVSSQTLKMMKLKRLIQQNHLELQLINKFKQGQKKSRRELIKLLIMEQNLQKLRNMSKLLIIQILCKKLILRLQMNKE